MAPRFNRGEYWLLTHVAEHGLPLNLVGMRQGPPWTTTTLQQTLNSEGHGMDTPTLARTLHRLARRRWIEFHSPPFGTSARHVVALDAAAIERALTLRANFSDSGSYCMTPLGGHVWESFAQPDWVRYIEDSTTAWIEGDAADGSEDWDRREVTTADRRTLEHYMEAVRNEDLIAAESESMEMRHDWTFCYWKPPRSAYVWRFTARQKDRLRPPATHWYRERWCEWR